jgi:hypothetical protein
MSLSDPAGLRRSLKEQIIRDMQEASRQVDDANGTSDYNMRLVALALIARHFLRECADDLLADPVGGASPPQDNALKIACAELVGYHDGFMGMPNNPTFSSGDENLAYQLWFGKARAERSNLCDQINTLGRLFEAERQKAVGGASPAPGWQVDREDLRAARDACWAQARDCENAARNMSDATMYQAAKQWNITAARLDAAMSAASSPSLEPPR